MEPEAPRGAITPAQWQALIDRIAELVGQETSVDEDLDALRTAVDTGAFDDLLAADELTQWVGLLHWLVSAIGDDPMRTLLLCAAVVLQRQVERAAAAGALAAAGRDKLRADALVLLADAFERAQQPANVAACYQVAAELYRDAGLLAQYAKCLLNEGIALQELGHHAAALPLYQEARPLFDQWSCPVLVDGWVLRRDAMGPGRGRGRRPSSAPADGVQAARGAPVRRWPAAG